MVVCELSVRDYTADLAAGVTPDLRGKYLGLASTAKLSTGIGHLKLLGVNTVELLPVAEFDDDPPGTYHWGYMPSLFLAPEASYATSPLGRQVTEFKHLVDTLHQQGLAVILDVVFNHTGHPHHLAGFDRKYYYRLDENLGNQNFSGCGNDFASERPMARRLIVDAVLHWLKEYHVDGFRFDLAELIDLETLRLVESEARKVNPSVILIAEPWSFRGHIKGAIKDTEWAYWNDDFRNRVKGFLQGKTEAKELAAVIGGSTSLWARSHLHSVNYLESHDDRTLADDLSPRKDHDAHRPGPKELALNRMAALLLLTSLGTPMIAQGQDFARSKGGKSNTYNAGDDVNAVDWTLRARRREVFLYYRDLIRFRLGEAGRSLRPAAPVGRDYVKVFRVKARSLAYLVNPDALRGARPVLVLLNASNTPQTFSLPSTSPRWFLAGTLRRIAYDPSQRKGLRPNRPIPLPPMSARLFLGER